MSKTILYKKRSNFNNNKMRIIVIIFCLIFCKDSIAQAKSKPTTKDPINELAKLMMGIGLPYKMANDSVAAIPYEGENIASYPVIIQKIGDLVIVYTNLSEALPGKIDDTKYKYLLQQNEHFDIVKIGMSGDDNSVFVRADLYKAGITTALLKRIVTQVANVTNIMAGELKL
jgi:hypothetical protein